MKIFASQVLKTLALMRGLLLYHTQQEFHVRGKVKTKITQESQNAYQTSFPLLDLVFKWFNEW